MNIGFIGAGKAGIALGRYLVDCNQKVVGYASATYASAQDAASFTNSRVFSSAAELAQASDLIFITTPDGVISSVWKELREVHRNNESVLTSKIIAHCSGCCASDIFEGAHEIGIPVCSVHPLLAFGDKEIAHLQVARAHFSVEGDEKALSIIIPLFEDLGNSVHLIKATDKTRYHAAAVFASNLVLSPLENATELLKQCGFTEDDARDALKPLVYGNIENFFNLGAAASLTGPVERNDLSTVSDHLHSLDDKRAALYRALTWSLIDIAKRKYPSRTYDAWGSVLGERLF